MAKESFQSARWEDFKDGELALFLNEDTRDKLFSKIGYSVDKQGFLVDDKIKERVKINGIEIKPSDIKGILAGSHIFIRNIGDLAEVLAQRNEIKIRPTDKS